MRRAVLLFVLLASAACRPATQPTANTAQGGLVLPGGFEATVFHEGVGRARHLAVTDDGIVYVKLRGPRPGQSGPDWKGLVALRDTSGNGQADEDRIPRPHLQQRSGAQDADDGTGCGDAGPDSYYAAALVLGESGGQQRQR